MDSDVVFVLLAIGAVLAALLFGPVAFVLLLVLRARIGRLERRLAEVERRRVPAVPAPAYAPPAATLPLEPEAGPGSEPEVEPTPEPQPEPPVPAAPEPPLPPTPAAPPTSAPSPVPPVWAAAETPRRPSLEERFGTRWTVWTGGIALALGALLLVRYSVEQGLFGPAARIGLGLLTSLGLIAGGEVLRRRLRAAEPAPGPRPDIPAMVTAAGIVALFGTIFAAHAVYRFLGPASAFVGLGLTGLAAMVAALLHGPALAGIGLVGAMAAPLLAGGKGASLWPLTLYLPLVAGFAYAFAWTRGWRFLAILAGIAAAGWSLLLGLAAGRSGAAAALIHASLQAGLAAWVFAVLPGRRVPADAAAPDRGAVIALAAGAATGLCVLLFRTGGDLDAAWIIGALAAIAVPAAAGFLAAPAAAGIPIAGAVLAAILVIWPQAGAAPGAPIDLPRDLLRGAAEPALLVTLALGAGLGVAAAGALRLLGASRLPAATAILYAAGAAATPLAALALAYLRLAHGEIAPGFAALASGLALAATLAAARFRRQHEATPSPALALGLGAFAAAAVAALCLGLVFALAGGSLTLAMALAAFGTAAIARRLDLEALRWCVAGLGLVVAGRLVWDPTVVGALSDTPILNGLLLGYGLPALAFGLSARLIRLPDRAPDAPVLVAQTLALVLSALLVFFEIRHAANGGDILAARTGFMEQGLMTLSALGFAAVLVRLDGLHGSPVIRIGSLAFGVAAMAQAGFGLLLAANPFFTSEAVTGGPVLNGIAAAYGLPALAAFGLAAIARPTRPLWYVRAAAILGASLSLAAVSLAVRRLFQGADIGFDRATGAAEWYAYSAAWLGLGLVLLAYGVLRGSHMARLASAGLVGLATVKVFLFDLAGLEGPLRALSFLGLGAALIGIGLVYQRLVFAPDRRIP